jgi:hypothetical protein
MMRTIPRQSGRHLLDFTYNLLKLRLSLGRHHIIIPSLLRRSVTDNVGIREYKPGSESASIRMILVDREEGAQRANAIQFTKWETRREIQ